MKSRLPIFIDLEAVPVLLVGGGQAAKEKLEKLIAVKADIFLVAKVIHSDVRQLLEEHRIDFEQRAFQDSDLDQRQLVISAVNQQTTHRMIAQAAKARKIWVNTVDAPEFADLFFAAQVQRGPLQVAISTGGSFPGLARSFRLWIEQQFPESATPLIEELVEQRLKLRTHIPEPVVRMRALKKQLKQWLDSFPAKQEESTWWQ